MDVTEYFVHGIDSRGKIFFVENDGSVEIREVTKFQCVSLTLEIDYTEEEITHIEEIIHEIEKNPFELDGETDPFFSMQPVNGTEGELFYNTNSNMLQKFTNGNWINISGPGGPPNT